MDEQTPPQPETSALPGRPRWPVKVLVVGAFVAAAALLGFVVLTGRRFWRPLPVVPPLPAAPGSIVRPDTIDVLLTSSKEPLEVSCPDGGSWYTPGERFVAMGEGPWKVTEAGGTIRIGDATVNEGEIQLRPNEDGFVLGDSEYRGSLTLKARADGRLRAFNTLPPEQYLVSVVGTEMYARWPLEALMAQAVAARTFMLCRLTERGYMVRTDMAYTGVDGESRPARLATELTRGIVLIYGGQLVPAYFQSTCGGHTVAGDRAFALEPIPPLRGVECPWCEGTRWYAWSLEATGREIAERLQRPGLDEVRSIEPLETEPDGYARYVLINGETKLDAGTLRSALGWSRMRSTCFTVSRRGEAFIFEGRGFGHGVGLCQWGARGMARAGYTWQGILLHYYPDAEIRKAY